MIGSGIFIVSADIARQVGSPGWLLVVWIITGLLTISAALSYGELAALFPHAGGQYIYLREAYSPLWGFLYGWTLFLVIQTGTIAAVAVIGLEHPAPQHGEPIEAGDEGEHPQVGRRGRPVLPDVGRTERPARPRRGAHARSRARPS